MSMERWWNDSDGGIPNYWDRRLLQCHFIHLTPHIDWPDIEHGPPHRQRMETTRQSQGTATVTFLIRE